MREMSTDMDCDKWQKETKWDIQVEHDKQIRAEVLKECWDKYNKMGYGFFEDWLLEQLKQNNPKPKSTRQELKGFIWDIW